MRIVAGQFKGRPIQAPKTKATRPTSDRARESLFNMIAHAPWAPPLEGAGVIDLFAGSGALGLEALSRGADRCVFVETAHPALAAVRHNIDAFNLTKAARIHRRSAAELGDLPDSLGGPFDLAFMDPPYHKNLVAPCLSGLKTGGWLTAEALIVVETGIDEILDLTGWSLISERESGAAKFWFLNAA